MSSRSIDDLVDALCRIPAGSFSRAAVLEEIGGRPLDPGSLAPYVFYSPDAYTRNLIHRCDLFEVLSICWDVGQSSAIHNHRDQECWMGVPIGRLAVQNFRVLERDPRARTCRLVASTRVILDPDHAAAVDPAEPIHSVHNAAEFAARAVSVHVYSRPFDSCEVYLPDQGRYLDMPLEYTSRFGVLCADPGGAGRQPRAT